ncbi:MAG TPA: prepilin-type N-terminal cleavage/methylation domain-containing protein [Gemmatimonadaceae bacterium]|nr:prepilin-type N-terminal cleavage/methylation domain-containing protein [Gemmatimonadaceae bacterium]
MRKRRGFTVLEILIGIALIAIMSAAVIPALMGRVRDAQTSALGQSLFSLSQAIFEYRKAVTSYPRELVLLARKPNQPSQPVDLDLCGNAITNGNANSWRGPYVSRELVSGGIGIGDAQIQNSLRRTPAAPALPTTLYIDVVMVDTLTAVDLEAQFDGDANPATGSIRYTTLAVPPIPAAAPGTVTLSYAMPVNGC